MLPSPPNPNSTLSGEWWNAAYANTEVRNIGKYLRYFTNKSFYFVPSPGNPTPPGLSNFSTGQPYVDGHIQSIVANSPGAGHDGMVGFFWDDTQCVWYFLLTNLLRTPTATASQAGQNFTIQFDASVNHVYRLNRSTGQEEQLNLTADHKLVLSLPGGTGDLFAYENPTYGSGFRPMGTVSINNDDDTTSSHNVTVSMLSFAAFGQNSVSSYCISTDGGSTWGSWQTYTPSSYNIDGAGKMNISLTLPSGAGYRGVAVKYKDNHNRVSPICSSVIYCTN